MPDRNPKRGGAIAWMAGNSVAANLAMLFLLVGGLFWGTHIKQEVFPEFDLDRVSIHVPYPGASPEEVEQGIILAIEEAVRGLEGVKEVNLIAQDVTAYGQDRHDGARLEELLRQLVKI